MDPTQNGRATLMRVYLPTATRGLDGEAEEVLCAPFSAHSKVHEYGGGAFLATPKWIFFVNGADQQVWQLRNIPGTLPDKPRQLTNASDWRFADFVYDEQHQRLICVGERHEKATPYPQNLLVTISLAKESRGEVLPLVKGDDFYASPRLSPDGQHLAFVSWNLPDMQWDNALLQVADLDRQGKAETTRCLAPELNGASFQPEWDRNGALWFINDETGYGQLYRHRHDKTEHFVLDQTECGAPLWNFGMKTHGLLADGRIAVHGLQNGRSILTLVNPSAPTGPHETVHQNHFCNIEQLVTLDNRVAGIFSCSTQPQTIGFLDNGALFEIKNSVPFKLPVNELSIAQNLVFENRHGQKVYGYYYPPANASFAGPEDEKPPVILTAHGGPTAFADCGLKLKIQFWTSRGFGCFDINYSGSWGFGKTYRDRLCGQWGIADTNDMIAGAQYLVDRGLAASDRLLISGSSAGGYTVLQTLVHSDLFAAGASYYGISDLARLNGSTHKFEAGYTASLLGLNEQGVDPDAILAGRSPLAKAERISTPVIFFQGLQDKVVPPEQAELMMRALKKRGIKTVCKNFTNEGHGFRRSQSIKTALEMEYEFYLDILGI